MSPRTLRSLSLSKGRGLPTQHTSPSSSTVREGIQCSILHVVTPDLFRGQLWAINSRSRHRGRDDSLSAALSSPRESPYTVLIAYTAHLTLYLRALFFLKFDALPKFL